LGTAGLALRKVRAKWANKPTGFVWIENRKLAASGYPASKDQLRWLSQQGIDCILTLTESPLPATWLEALPLEAEHIPMKDHEPPGMASLDRAADFISEKIAEGNSVAVHCLAGKGRTMCAIAAYMIKNKGLGAKEAMIQLRKVRPGAVEFKQEKSIYEYAEALSKKTA
jgi:atypical dual specificity phosphatase